MPNTVLSFSNKVENKIDIVSAFRELTVQEKSRIKQKFQKTNI